jgi:diguanylate cyclase (GGDEF)-like protein
MADPKNPGRPDSVLPRTASGDAQERTRKLFVRREGPNRKVMLLALRVVAGRDMLRFVTLHSDDELLIGRDEGLLSHDDAGLVLSDASVSRRHARVICSDDGTVTVEDLGSTNGTAVNGRQVDQSPLRPGDHLEIGGVSLRLDLLSLEEVAHLENVLARLELKNRDPLTGLLDRSWIDLELPVLAQHAERERLQMACLFADIDNFKQVNDRFGHLVGDEVLIGVSRLMMVGIRETDTCVRYGGEELLMFLNGSGEDVAFDVAERVRVAIETHDWSRTNPDLRVTTSIGVAALVPGETPKQWIHRADRALYAAKAGGRNRTTRASGLA